MFHLENRTEIAVKLKCKEKLIFDTDFPLSVYIFTGLSSGAMKPSQRINHTLTSGLLLLTSVLLNPFPCWFKQRSAVDF